MFIGNNELIDAYEPDEYQNDDLMFNDEEVNLVQESIKHASSFNDEKNNNVEIALPLEASIKEPTNNELLKPLEADSFANRLNISRESDVLKLPNAL